MLFRFLSLFSLTLALRYLETNNDSDSYQVLLYFWPAFLGLNEDFSSPYLGPGCVIALQKLEDSWDFTTTLGREVGYKMVDQPVWSLSDTLEFIESQLVTKKYDVQGRIKSELSLILGPIGLMVFVKPYCYQNRYNCIFGIGKATSASINAVSEDFRKPYQENNQVTNNIFLDNIKDSPYHILAGLFGAYRWNFRHIAIFSETLDSGDMANSLILSLQELLISHNVTFVKDFDYTDARNNLFNIVPYSCRGERTISLQFYVLYYLTISLYYLNVLL